MKIRNWCNGNQNACSMAGGGGGQSQANALSAKMFKQLISY